MLGLFGLLNMGARSLATEQQGVEVAGQNLSNVNNPAYARQRVVIATSPTVQGDLGPQGTGAEATGIVQIRSAILDNQVQGEASVSGSLEAQQSALQYAEAALGEQLDSAASSAGAGAASSVGSSHSLADGLADLFNGFQSVSSDPSSLAERQALLGKASSLAVQFNQVNQRLTDLNTSLNTRIQTDTESANSILSQIANLNDQISRAELGAPGSANDLRDARQSKIEDLAKLVKIDVTNGSNGTLNVSIAGTLMVTGNQTSNTLETFDAGGGQLMVRAAGTTTALALTGGSIQGTIDGRDGGLADLQSRLNTLSSSLITEVNAVHTAGFGLNGSTGAKFFNGSDAATIQVNSALVTDPSLVQAASAPGAAGDNGVALALAQLGQKALPALGNQTFTQNYSQVTTNFGQSLASVNSQLSDQQVVGNMLLQQRASVSGVSMDEEMTDLTKFQRAFEASAKLITTVDDMLNTVVNLKQ